MRNTYNKFKSVILIGLLLLIITSILSGAVFANSNHVFAEENTISANSNTESSELDTDMIAGTNLTIRDYSEQLHATEAAVRVSEKDNTGFELYNLDEDDPIINIVPKNYFFTVGNIVNIGDEYGYFINTEETANKTYISTVLVFDITTNTDLVATTDRVIVEVSPIFQYKYAGLTNQTTMALFNGVYLRYGVLDESRVVAYPSKMENSLISHRVEYEMTEEYYLKDVSFGASLYNEQALNYGDAGYDPYNDYGSYFTGFDYSYQGKYREKGEFNVGDMLWNVTDNIFTALGYIKFSPGPLGTAAKVFGAIYDVISFGKGWIDFASDPSNLGKTEFKTTEKLITATCYYQNRDDQLKYYRDDYGNPVLTKTAEILFDTDAEKSIWYGVGDNVTAYFNIGHSALGNRTPNYTCFIDQLAVQIATSNGNEDISVAAGSTIIHDNLREPEIKELDFLNSGDIYMLPEGEDHLTYKNLVYESDYTIDIALTDNATVNVNGQVKTGKDLSFNVHAKEHEDIEIDLKNSEVGLKGTVSISPNASTIINSISPDGEYLLKTKLNGIKDLQLSNTNLVIKNIYLLKNGQLSPYESYVQFVQGNSITYPFEAGQDYYLVIANNSLTKVSSALLQVGDIQNYKPEEEIVLSKEVKAISVSNTYSSEMCLQIVFPEDNDSAFSIFNTNGVSISHLTTYVRDDVIYKKYSFTLSAGEVCYIFCSIVRSESFTILPDNNYVKWEIDGTIYNGYDIQLQRGEIYEVRLLYKKGSTTYELTTGYNLDNKPQYYTFNSDGLSIKYAVPYEYVITIVPIKYPEATLRITPTEGREDIDYTVTLNKDGGTGGTSSIIANYNRAMPTATKPSRTGYTFRGYFSGRNGTGTQYYDSNMKGKSVWDKESNATLYAYWTANEYMVNFDTNGGSGGTLSVEVVYGQALPIIELPTREGYNFLGYYTSPSGGTCYYEFFDLDAISEYEYYNYYAQDCDFAYNRTLYARWEEMSWVINVKIYVIGSGYASYEDSDAYPKSVSLAYGQNKVYYAMGVKNYDLDRWELKYPYGTIAKGTDTRVNLTNLCKGNYESYTLTFYYYFNPDIEKAYGMEAYIQNKTGSTWTIHLTNNTGKDRKFQYNSLMCFYNDAGNWSGLKNVVETETIKNGKSTTVKITENALATSIAISYIEGETRYILYAKDLNSNNFTMNSASNTVSAKDSECIAKGTLITLADGSQKSVELLTGDELLLVWNMYTGTFDSAPILCVDSDPLSMYEVIRLSFSDGTIVDVISEHGFYDVDMNQYIYLDEHAADYIGHSFLKQDVDGMVQVTLEDVDIVQESTTAYSPVTYGHLCYFVNGMLSMPGGIDGLFNIFEVDPETMMYDAETMAADIEKYGLYTYEELSALVSVPEVMFDAVNGQYLKVAVGKGIITIDQIGELVERYADLFE